MESVGCDPSAALGDFRCPATAELSSLAQRFFPFPRFPVAKDPRLYIICLDGVPRLNSCGEGSLFSEELEDSQLFLVHFPSFLRQLDRLVSLFGVR